MFRGAFRVLAKGEIEAGKAAGMSQFLLFRRIIAPQVLRHALPGIGNVWQMALKESALISVTGLVELLRQSRRSPRDRPASRSSSISSPERFSLSLHGSRSGYSRGLKNARAAAWPEGLA